MKKKIKDLSLKDMPKCWTDLFDINPVLMCLFTTDENKFEYMKSTLPDDIANMEVEV